MRIFASQAAVSAAIALLLAASSASGQGLALPAAPTDNDYYDNGNPDPAKVSLGAQLFFDKELSGNRNISCATCHHSLTDTGDGLSLPIGEGGRGLGVTRDTGLGQLPGFDPVHERVPRNAPPVFNLGAREFKTLFHDGRVAAVPNEPCGFLSPAGADLPCTLDNVLAVQAMFPVTSATEMAGQAGENPIADAAAANDLPLVWDLLAGRLKSIPAYIAQFQAVYGIGEDAITYAHAANAIAAFEAFNWRADNSPFDRYLRGDRGAMSQSAQRGMRVFYLQNKGNCASCHSGPFQTNHGFASIAAPQIGGGKGDGLGGREDFGRERVTGDPTDRYRFRIPSLRNIALTAPYGHAGVFDTLEGMVRHHLDAVASFNTYDTSQAVLPSRPDLDALDFDVMTDGAYLGARTAIKESSQVSPVNLSAGEFSDLLEFLHALTDASSIDLRKDVPGSLPSGIPLAE
jgi:cytochrome c peroxidase